MKAIEGGSLSSSLRPIPVWSSPEMSLRRGKLAPLEKEENNPGQQYHFHR